MTANAISFGSDLMMKCQSFSQLWPINWHGLAPMGQQETASHYFMMHNIHIDNIQWSGGN
jgi:hypothetical protein